VFIKDLNVPILEKSLEKSGKIGKNREKSGKSGKIRKKRFHTNKCCFVTLFGKKSGKIVKIDINHSKNGKNQEKSGKLRELRKI